MSSPLTRSCFAAVPFSLRPAVGVILALTAVCTVHAQQLTLRWADNSNNEKGFRIERATGSSSFYFLATVGANTTRYVDRDVAPSTSYRYRVCAYNRAGKSRFSNTSSATTGSSSGNTAPTIAAAPRQTVPRNGMIKSLPVTIGDAETSAKNLQFTATSSNTSLVPNHNIYLGGGGSTRYVTAWPVYNKKGSTTVTLKVSDGRASRSTSFTFLVGDGQSSHSNKITYSAGDGGSRNSAPTITAISNYSVPRNGRIESVPVTIGDAETAAKNLRFTATSSNTSLVPNHNIHLGGGGSTRYVAAWPAYNKKGSTTITLKVSDGQVSRSTSFTFSVGSLSLPGDDGLLFSGQPLQGDAELTVRVTRLDNTNGKTRAGVMFRASNAPGAPFAAAYVTGKSRLVLRSRSAQGADIEYSPTLYGKAPQWLRLTRVGVTFYAFASRDGKSWDLIEFMQMDMPHTALGGKAATAVGGATAKTADFEGFTID